MLRTAVTWVAAASTLTGAALCLAGIYVPGGQLFGFGLIVLVGVLVERWRYSKEPRPGADWQPTDERFVDPTSGRRMRVLYDAKSGERRYVNDDEGPRTER